MHGYTSISPINMTHFECNETLCIRHDGRYYQTLYYWLISRERCIIGLFVDFCRR